MMLYKNLVKERMAMDQDFKNFTNITLLYAPIDDDDRKEELMAKKIYLYEQLKDEDYEEASIIFDQITDIVKEYRI